MRQYLLITGNKTVRRFLEFAKNNKLELTVLVFSLTSFIIRLST